MGRGNRIRESTSSTRPTVFARGRASSSFGDFFDYAFAKADRLAHQIASEICRAGFELGLQANLALASNPDSAILIARHTKGVTLVTPGEEYIKLGPVRGADLFAYDAVRLDPGMLPMLVRWGVKTCEDVLALPQKEIIERLGAAGVYLRNLAAGKSAVRCCRTLNHPAMK